MFFFCFFFVFLPASFSLLSSHTVVCTDAAADCKQFKQRLVSTEVKEYRAEKILRDNEDGRTGGQGHHHGDESKPCGTPAGEPPVIIIRSGAHERHFRVSDTFRTSDALVRHLRLYVEGVEEVHPRPDLRQG